MLGNLKNQALNISTATTGTKISIGLTTGNVYKFFNAMAHRDTNVAFQGIWKVNDSVGNNVLSLSDFDSQGTWGNGGQGLENSTEYLGAVGDVLVFVVSAIGGTVTLLGSCTYAERTP